MRFLCTIVAASALWGSTAGAQPRARLGVLVTDEAGNALAASLVWTAADAEWTNNAGRATLVLSGGVHRVVTFRLGYIPDTGHVTIVSGRDTSIVIALRAHALEPVIVGATRSERRIEETPLRVEVLGREEVEEKMLMTPGDITMMMNETGGLRVQTTSPSLGGASVRVQGLAGRYTLMLSDGLPLHGGQAGGLGLLQIPPMDLAQVEVVKGVASALYGSSALGGVINLVSRRPRDDPERELLLNATTRGGTDAIGWSSQRISDRLGYTALVGWHLQPDVDIDRDGWVDMPDYDRIVVRPRLFWNGDKGRSVMLTAGSTIEERAGGTRIGAVAPDGAPFPEGLDTRRYDGGAIARFPFKSSVLSARASGTSLAHHHTFGPRLERDVHQTGFGEVSLATTLGRHGSVVGAAWQRDAFESTDLPRFDYAYDIPAAFAQYDITLDRSLALSASARADFHSQHGVLFNPRLSLLYRLSGGWTARLSGGTGAFAPTPFTDESEATGLTPVRIVDPLRVERATSGSFDIGGVAGAFEFNGTAFGSRVVDPLMARTVDSGVLELFSNGVPATTIGADALGRIRAGEVTATLSYTYVRAREHPTVGTPARDVPLTPRHSAGLVTVWEREDRGRVGLEYYYTGRQLLDENPFRTFSPAYSVFGAIGEWHLGRARVFLNLENIGNVRLTRVHPFVRPFTGAPELRWTVDAWGPLDGRVINGGIRLSFGSHD